MPPPTYISLPPPPHPTHSSHPLLHPFPPCPHVCSLCLAGRFFTTEPPGKSSVVVLTSMSFFTWSPVSEQTFGSILDKLFSSGHSEQPRIQQPLGPWKDLPFMECSGEITWLGRGLSLSLWNHHDSPPETNEEMLAFVSVHPENRCPVCTCQPSSCFYPPPYLWVPLTYSDSNPWSIRVTLSVFL